VTVPDYAAVDRYLTDLLVPPDAALDAALAASDAAGLPPHHVSPAQGKLLMLLAQLRGARRILEIGTLAGYSTIWLARALPPTAGRLITLESNPKHADIARDNIARAGLADRVDLRLGPALESLTQLAAERSEPLDLIFIDADKPNNPAYLTACLRLSRPGTLIIADNVIRDGAVADPRSTDPSVQGIRRFLEMLAADPRLSATAIQTVGEKGHDGFALAVVIAS
jgi:predicted O-methyltransferase YrrM